MIGDHESQAPLPPARRRRSLPARIVRFPVKFMLMLLVGIVFTIRRRPRWSVGIFVLLVAAGAAYYYFAPVPPPLLSPAASTQPALTSAQGSLPAPQSPEQYLRAQATGDAAAMWALLSDSVEQTTSVQQLQAKLNQVRPREGALDQITYVGGARETNGDAVYLYLLTWDKGGQSAQETYLFTLDANGRIVDVE